MTLQQTDNNTYYLLAKGDVVPSSLTTALLQAINAAHPEGSASATLRTEPRHKIGEVDIEQLSKVAAIICWLEPDTDIFYALGIAQGLGKPILYLVDTGTHPWISEVFPTWFVHRHMIVNYKWSIDGDINLLDDLRERLVLLHDNPRKFIQYSSFFAPYSAENESIEFATLDKYQFENLCFELLLQMGFTKVDWQYRSTAFDLVATLTKTDPDGFSYKEMWCVKVVDKDMGQSLFLLRDVFWDLREALEALVGSPGGRWRGQAMPLTVLLISRDVMKPIRAQDIEDEKSRVGFDKSNFRVRFRIWDVQYLRATLANFPQLINKYFSKNTLVDSTYRKSSDELYQENVYLSEKLLAIEKSLEQKNAILQEEKRRRFIAERETAWKDVAFKAAHKLGNPVSTASVLLQGIMSKIHQGDIAEALERAKMMDGELEKSKGIISQFTSLTKVEAVYPIPCNLEPLIQEAAKVATIDGIEVSVETEPDMPNALADPQRMEECLSELYNNSKRWFDKPQKQIAIQLRKASARELPDGLDPEKTYIRLTFRDNGTGITLELKERIFSPFVTTYAHGSGLGLALIKKIIEAQAGWILEDGIPGQGAQFVIFLPVENK